MTSASSQPGRPDDGVNAKAAAEVPRRAPQSDAGDAGLQICDPHRHIWDLPDRRYDPASLQSDLQSGHRVDHVVVVESGSHYRSKGPPALRCVGETEYLASLQLGDLLVGVVAFVDMSGSDASAVLDAHINAGAGLVRGVRQVTTWDPLLSPHARRPNPPGVLDSAPFRSGMRSFARYGLPFDACVYHHQLGEVARLARDFPEVTFVLDHLGGPVTIGPYAQCRQEVDEAWRLRISDLALYPNLVVKLGGISWLVDSVTPAGREVDYDPGVARRLAEMLRSTFLFCIETFGADRCMFESNFPPDRSVCTERDLWSAYKVIAAEASSAERASLFSQTAMRTYRL